MRGEPDFGLHHNRPVPHPRQCLPHTFITLVTLNPFPHTFITLNTLNPFPHTFLTLVTLNPFPRHPNPGTKVFHTLTSASKLLTNIPALN